MSVEDSLLVLVMKEELSGDIEPVMMSVRGYLLVLVMSKELFGDDSKGYFRQRW